jgi:hypothetical protein
MMKHLEHLGTGLFFFGVVLAVPAAVGSLLYGFTVLVTLHAWWTIGISFAAILLVAAYFMGKHINSYY